MQGYGKTHNVIAIYPAAVAIVSLIKIENICHALCRCLHTLHSRRHTIKCHRHIAVHRHTKGEWCTMYVCVSSFYFNPVDSDNRRCLHVFLRRRFRAFVFVCFGILPYSPFVYFDCVSKRFRTYYFIAIDTYPPLLLLLLQLLPRRRIATAITTNSDYTALSPSLVYFGLVVVRCDCQLIFECFSHRIAYQSSSLMDSILLTKCLISHRHRYTLRGRSESMPTNAGRIQYGCGAIESRTENVRKCHQRN